MKNKIYLLSGPKHSGKTTRLAEWCANRTDVGGILQPEINGQRYFENIQTQRQILLDAKPTDRKVYEVGKFRFLISAFAWANDCLVEAPENPAIKWLIIDEVGPLELQQQQGLHPALERLLEGPLPGISVVLVVRDELVDKVLKRYRIKDQVEEFRFPEE